MAKTLLLWVVIAVVLLTVFQSFNPRVAATADLPYSEFMQAVRDSRVDEVLVHNDGRTIEAKLRDGTSVRTTALLTEQAIADIEKGAQKVKVEATDP
ncbi:MAG: ATP-dependent metallopeptidase FtsH/Yme1/Tma family protein, partial [Dokdonella sp.]